jgi:hypothetical protein
MAALALHHGQPPVGDPAACYTDLGADYHDGITLSDREFGENARRAAHRPRATLRVWAAQEDGRAVAARCCLILRRDPV